MTSIPEPLPIEDLDHGLYIHETDKVIITQIAGETTYSVDAGLFMEVQRERDNWRRTAWLINEALSRGDIDGAIKRLEAQGLHAPEARAMADIIAWVRSET